MPIPEVAHFRFHSRAPLGTKRPYEAGESWSVKYELAKGAMDCFKLQRDGVMHAPSSVLQGCWMCVSSLVHVRALSFKQRRRPGKRAKAGGILPYFAMFLLRHTFVDEHGSFLRRYSYTGVLVSV